MEELGGCKMYPLPNQTLKHVDYAEEEAVDRGLDPDDSLAVFVGGVLYAHHYKAKHPEAEVVAIEANPMTAHTQEYAARQVNEGMDPLEIVDDLFFRSRLDDEYFDFLSEKEYEKKKRRHLDFANDPATHSSPDQVNQMFFEADYGPYEPYVDTGCEDVLEMLNREDYFEEVSFDMDSDAEFDAGDRLEPLLKQFNSGEKAEMELGPFVSYLTNISAVRGADNLNSAMRTAHNSQFDAACQEAARQLRESAVSKELIEDKVPHRIHTSEWGLDPTSRIHRRQHKVIDESHALQAAQQDAYVHVSRADDNVKYVLSREVHAGMTHEEVLEEIEDVDSPDEVIVEDVRDVEMEADIVFTNNVFSYMDDKEAKATISSLASSEGAFLEYSRLTQDLIPENVCGIRNKFSKHILSSV